MMKASQLKPSSFQQHQLPLLSSEMYASQEQSKKLIKRGHLGGNSKALSIAC